MTTGADYSQIRADWDAVGHIVWHNCASQTGNLFRSCTFGRSGGVLGQEDRSAVADLAMKFLSPCGLKVVGPAQPCLASRDRVMAREMET